MKEIGGYFELELCKSLGYHAQALSFNSGRNCVAYIIKVQKPTKVFVPYYICDSLLEPLILENVPYQFYKIDTNFEIVDDLNPKQTEKILYVNYFGIKTEYVNELVAQYQENLIIDNSQNFYGKPLHGIDTFYSPRKFFGVSDGGYLYTDRYIEENFQNDESVGFAIQLLGRRDKCAADYYDYFLKAERRLINQPIKKMSKLTDQILQSIDYEAAREQRNCNFEYLHAALKQKNHIKISLSSINGPMTYPYKTSNKKLKSYLISQNIFVPTYWKEVETRENCNVEKGFVEELVALPIDQRYDLRDMERILTLIQNKEASNESR